MIEIPNWFIEMWQNTALRVEGVYSIRLRRGDHGRGAAHHLWTYLVVTEGRLRLHQGAWNADLEPGDQTLLLPSSPTVREVLSATCQWTTFDFRVQATGLGTDPLPSLGLPAVVHRPLTADWLDLLQATQEAMRSEIQRRNGVFAARGAVDLIVGRYLQNGITSGAIGLGRRTHVPAWLSLARQQLSGEFANTNADITSLAIQSGFSTTYFRRVFKKTFGVSPMEFLWEHRLQMAVRKLDTDPSIPVGNIASACGFKSHTHFTRLFRQRFGMTPKQWRLRWATSDAS